jgi:hypothetical protein
VSDDLFAKFDAVARAFGSYLEGLGFEPRNRKRRSFGLQYPNGWRLSVFLQASQHNRKADDAYRFALKAHLYDEGQVVKWWWSSSVDLPGRRRPQRDRRWQTVDPNTEPAEFQSSLQSDLDVMTSSIIGLRKLTHATDVASLVAELGGWVSESILPAAQLEMEGNSGPPLTGERSE